MLSTQDRIRLGQCFNLAHKEAIEYNNTLIHEGGEPTLKKRYIKARTIELFQLLGETESELMIMLGKDKQTQFNV